MEVCYRVVFQPDGTGDFQGELHFVTEREQFMLAVKATGARGGRRIESSPRWVNDTRSCVFSSNCERVFFWTLQTAQQIAFKGSEICYIPTESLLRSKRQVRCTLFRTVTSRIAIGVCKLDASLVFCDLDARSVFAIWTRGWCTSASSDSV
jgi:hypothetical protein